MTSKSIFFYFVVLLEGVWGFPASRPYGAQVSQQFSQDLASVIQNLHNGVTKVADPAIKFGMDTVPSMVNTGIKSLSGRLGKVADVGHDVFGKVVTGVGHAVGGAAIAGSALAGGGLQVAGSGLGAVNGVVGSAAQAGLDIAGRLGDTINPAGILTNALPNLGNALLTGSGDGSSLYNALKSFLDIIVNLQTLFENMVKSMVSSAGATSPLNTDS